MLFVINKFACGNARSTLAEHVRKRRDEKSERATQEAQILADQERDRPRGDLRICAATGDPMLATEAQLGAERDVRRLRMVRRMANRFPRQG